MLRALILSPFLVMRLAWVAYRSRYRGYEQWEVFRVLVALWLKATFGAGNTGEYRQRLFDFDVAGSSYALLLVLFKELFLSEPYKFISDTDNPLILDGGANIGMAIFYFKKQFPKARILAFEPNPEAFQLLARNVAVNRLHDVELYNVALAPTAGEVSFYYGDDGASLTGSLLPHAAGVRSVRVPARPLADYIGLSASVDLLKLDIEGTEADLLDSLDQNGLLSCMHQIILEYHYPIGTAKSLQFAECLQALERRGFAYYFKQVYPRATHEQDIVLHCWQHK